MSRQRGLSGLSGGEKDQLLADLRAAKSTRKDRKSAPRRQATYKNNAPKSYDFNKLEDYRQIRMQAAAAEMVGIENPFFRPHETIAKDTTLLGNNTLINFSSYNYLGLNGHPDVSAAAKAAIDRYGTSVSASRVVAGERPVHRELEAALANLHGVEDSVVMVSGHATNVTTIGQLLGPEDVIFCDSLSHSSIVEGAKLSGATRLMFAHNDLDALEKMLLSKRSGHRRAMIAIEGLYSMDGDIPDLPRFIELKRRYDCWLLVDEAHSIGVLGATGRGIAEHFRIDPKEVEIWMGTLSKTFSGCGGYIAGSRALVEYLKITAPGFVYSVGLSPPVAAAAIASAEVLVREPERVQKLKQNGHLFVELAREAGLDIGTSDGYSVVPVIVGDSVQAAMLTGRLKDRGFNVLPIIFPAVPEKGARLRFFITSEHSEEQIRQAVAATKEELEKLRSEGPLISKLINDR